MEPHGITLKPLTEIILIFQVAEIQALSSQLEVLNTRLITELQQCEHNHNKKVSETAKDMENKQKDHDDRVCSVCTQRHVMLE